MRRRTFLTTLLASVPALAFLRKRPTTVRGPLPPPRIQPINGDPGVLPEEFAGLAGRGDAGEMYLITWGDETIHGIYQKNKTVIEAINDSFVPDTEYWPGLLDDR